MSGGGTGRAQGDVNYTPTVKPLEEWVPLSHMSRIAIIVLTSPKFHFYINHVTWDLPNLSYLKLLVCSDFQTVPLSQVHPGMCPSSTYAHSSHFQLYLSQVHPGMGPKSNIHP